MRAIKNIAEITLATRG